MNLFGLVGPSRENPCLGLWGLLGPCLYLDPPSGTFTQNSYLTPRNLLKPWNFGTSWILYLELFLGTWEPLGTLLDVEPLLGPGMLEPSGNLHLEPPASFAWNLYLEPRNLPEASLGTCLEPLNRNLYLEPLHRLELLLGTSANLYL